MFTLRPHLAADCFVVGDLPLCRVLLMNDAQYPWLILVPRSDAELRELCELSEEDRLQFSRESDLAAGILNTVFAAEKLNIAALGNMVPQLHVHHIARFAADPCWPKPVWGQLPAKAYADSDREERLAALRHAFAAEPRFISG